MRVKLHSPAHAGQKVGSRWGRVLFDSKGDAEVDVASDAEVAMLVALRWSPEVQAEVEKIEAPPASSPSSPPPGVQIEEAPVVQVEEIRPKFKSKTKTKKEKK